MTDEKALVKIENDGNWKEAFESETWVAPKTNIFEDNDNYYLEINIPGVSRDGIQVKLENNSLIVIGKIDYKNIALRKYILQENDFGNYYRKYNLSENVNIDKIEAGYENGQLIITLPKDEKIKPRTIQIS
jgi:HSP20 family protein